MQRQIAVIGSASGNFSNETINKARLLGRLLAENNFIVLNGACTGIPDIIAREAKKFNAMVIGISPAESLAEHKSKWNYPFEYFDAMIFPGINRARNFILVRSADAIIVVGGRTGTLNEFTFAFDEGKIIAVLEGTGGIADNIERILEFAGKAKKNHLIIEENPEKLIEKLKKALALVNT